MPFELVEVPARHLHDNIGPASARRSRGALRDLVLQFVEAVADGQLRRDLGDRITVAFEASAEERDTRGLISMTMISSSLFGLTENWMLQPPAKLPIPFMHLMARSRIFW